MDQANLMFWLLPALFALMIGGFLTFDRVEKGVPAARLGAMAFAFGMVGIIAEAGRKVAPDIVGHIVIPLHWLAILCLVQAFVVRNRLTMPLRPLLAATALASLAHSAALVSGHAETRVFIANLFGAVIIVCGLYQLRSKSRRPSDRVIFRLLVAAALIYVLRPLVLFIGGFGSDYGGQASWSAYTQIAYVSTTLVALILALALMLALTLDAIARSRRAAWRDPLTGIANRQAYQSWASNPAVSAATQAVLMFDIDHFKAINDNYGHAAGDNVLRRVAETIREMLPANARFARIGGEEFVVLLSETGPAGALAVAQSVREAIAALEIVDVLGTISATVSIGVGGHTPGGCIEETAARADRALYRAKHSGRNCVIADEPRAAMPSRNAA